jgi:hypothetical protein
MAPLRRAAPSQICHREAHSPRARPAAFLAMAIRFAKPAVRLEGFIHTAAIDEWL